MIRNYSIYTHTSPSGKVYVGQSISTKRRWGYNGEHYMNKKKDGSYVQNAFAKALLKYGWDNFKHEIILEGIPKSEADYAEKYLIKWYKLHNQSYNITDGGEGTCGHHSSMSEEAKQKLLLFLHTTPPMKGKHHTEETKRKISEAFKGRKLSEERKKQMSEISKRHKHSEESKLKMSAYRKAHPETWVGGWNKKEVHQYDLQGNYVASFPSASDAAKCIAKESNTTMILDCAKGKRPSALGYVWRFDKTDSLDMSKYKIVNTTRGLRLYDMSDRGKRSRRNSHGKAVNQYTLEGKYITTFNSVTDAKEALGYSGGGIGKCCMHLPRYVSAAGFLWEYDNIENRIDKNMEE